MQVGGAMMRSGLIIKVGIALLCASVAGCVPPPAVAFPGEGKSYAAFQADDAQCHQAAAQVHPAQYANPPPGVAAQTPALVYAQCMTARGNRIGPPPAPPVVYAPPPPPVVYGYGPSVYWGYGFY